MHRPLQKSDRTRSRRCGCRDRRGSRRSRRVERGGDYFEAEQASRFAFLNLDEPYPKEVFTILIWDCDRAKFGAPEAKYKDARGCVTGRVAHSSRVAKDGLFVPRFLTQQSRADTPGHKLSVMKVSYFHAQNRYKLVRTNQHPKSVTG